MLPTECSCLCHRRAGVVSPEGIPRIMLPPRVVNKNFNVPLDDPIEAVSACDGCVRFHIGRLVRTPVRVK
jgi:hypothetical protein